MPRKGKKSGAGETVLASYRLPRSVVAALTAYVESRKLYIGDTVAQAIEQFISTADAEPLTHVPVEHQDCMRSLARMLNSGNVDMVEIAKRTIAALEQIHNARMGTQPGAPQ